MNPIVEASAKALKPKIEQAMIQLSQSGAKPITIGALANRVHEHPSIVVVTVKMLAEEGLVVLDPLHRTVSRPS